MSGAAEGFGRIYLGDTLRGEIKGAMSVFGCGADTRDHWLRHDGRTVWLCTSAGRVGVGVARIRSGDRVSTPAAGPDERANQRAKRPAAGPFPEFAYVVVLADGEPADRMRFMYVSKAVEAALHLAGRFARRLAESG